jgi:hypothetical protein
MGFQCSGAWHGQPVSAKEGAVQQPFIIPFFQLQQRQHQALGGEAEPLAGVQDRGTGPAWLAILQPFHLHTAFQNRDVRFPLLVHLDDVVGAAHAQAGRAGAAVLVAGDQHLSLIHQKTGASQPQLGKLVETAHGAPTEQNLTAAVAGGQLLGGPGLLLHLRLLLIDEQLLSIENFLHHGGLRREHGTWGPQKQYHDRQAPRIRQSPLAGRWGRPTHGVILLGECGAAFAFWVTPLVSPG